MSKFIKVLAVSSALLVLAQAGAASAGEWRHRDSGDDMLAVGIAGLAAGVIAGAIVSGSNNGPRDVQVYDNPPPPRFNEPPVYRERPVYDNGYDRSYRPANYYRPRAWSREWYRYCSSHYDSFDPQTGTYVDDAGDEHFCRAR